MAWPPNKRDHGQWGLCECVIVHTILPPSPVILWIQLGGKPKWLPLKFGYHDVIRTSPINRDGSLTLSRYVFDPYPGSTDMCFFARVSLPWPSALFFSSFILFHALPSPVQTMTCSFLMEPCWSCLISCAVCRGVHALVTATPDRLISYAMHICVLLIVFNILCFAYRCTCFCHCNYWSALDLSASFRFRKWSLPRSSFSSFVLV